MLHSGGDLMVTIQTVRFNVKSNCSEAFENAVNQIIKALREAANEGIRYTMCKSGEGTTFLERVS